jgi:transcriptional regulator with XRE-family HTH domain
MTVRMNAEQLDRELARRGWNATDLARAAGCSAATISGARRGRPISSTTLCKIAEALRQAPVIPGIDELIGTELTIVEGGASAHG